MNALRGPHLEAVRLLIQEGADINTPDKVRQGLLIPRAIIRNLLFCDLCVFLLLCCIADLNLSI
jgi:hypothetical protein